MLLINGSLMVIFGTIIYLVSRGIFIGKTYKNQGHVTWLKEILRFLFAVYICMVASVTLFPLPIAFSFEFHPSFRTVNVVPLASIIKNISLIGTAYDGDVLFMIKLLLRNVGGNILLFIPLGFLAPIIWEKYRSLKSIILFGLIISMTIEIVQFIESFTEMYGRVTDIDDVICNVIGAAVGYMVFVLVMRLGRALKINSFNDLNV
ncbi:VanZ family protein [Falsibacillus albus]|uniref:VanZ family protein n=1 Tax=Falsibacillus albus TaxID=2478915 RepID=A0A3L7JRI3_9BACI|nr:VanZ family protein [Falsibacillus albus]RLQ92301.1 VanZ family protein [Falsibacillus albus]